MLCPRTDLLTTKRQLWVIARIPALRVVRSIDAHHSGLCSSTIFVSIPVPSMVDRHLLAQLGSVMDKTGLSMH